MQNFSLDIRRCEIVGLAGVDGNGQKELCEILTGLRPAESGTLQLDGKDVTNRTPNYYIKQHISHITEDRQTIGLALNWNLKNNLIIKQLGNGPFTRKGFIEEKLVDQNWEKARDAYQIKAIDGNELARSLSGGNQQKLILARELSLDPRVLIANQPTRGLDVRAAEYVRSQILKARNSGTAVLLVSADLEEILQLSDRIAVIYDGQLMGIMPRGADPMDIGALMMGKKQEVHN